MDGSYLITDSYKKAKIKTPSKDRNKDVAETGSPFSSTQDSSKETIVWACDTPHRKNIRPGKAANSKINLDSLVQLAKKKGEDSSKNHGDEDLMNSVLVAGITSVPRSEPLFFRATSFEDHGLEKLLITLKKVPSSDDASKKEPKPAEQQQQDEDLWGDMSDSLMLEEEEQTTLLGKPEVETWTEDNDDEELLLQATQAVEAAYCQQQSTSESDPLLEDDEDSLLLKASQAVEEAYVATTTTTTQEKQPPPLADDPNDSWSYMDPDVLVALETLEDMATQEYKEDVL